MHYKSPFKFLKICICLSIIFAPFQEAFGQSGQKARRVEEGKRTALDFLLNQEQQILSDESRLFLDYGGWLDIRHEEFQDTDNDSDVDDTFTSSFSVDPRFWMRFILKPPADGSYPNEHVVYLRLKHLYVEKRPPDQNEGYDRDGPHIDYAYAVIDLRPFSIEVGRRYYMVGQGIAYGNVNDGAELLLNLNNWTIRGFVSQTLPHEDNIDTSVPNFESEGDRTYYAAEATYVGLYGHGIYGYYLAQRDGGGKYPSTPTNDFTYDSEYIGLGLQGKLFPQVHYWAEVMKETGESRVFTTQEVKDIDAWAADFGVTWDIDVYSHPNVTFESAFGSGDADRTSVTDTENGNLTGDDNNFLYFGYLPAGFALAPRLSNLQFYKLSLLAKPLEKYNRFKNLTFGVDYYRYYKDEKSGGIYDEDAVLAEKYVGSELDMRLSWKMLSDLSWTIEYGYFMPGDAYAEPAKDSESYFSIGTTFTF